MFPNSIIILPMLDMDLEPVTTSVSNSESGRKIAHVYIHGVRLSVVCYLICIMMTSKGKLR